MRKQRLYWLAEIAEGAASKWLTGAELRRAMEREAGEGLTDDEFAEVLRHLLQGGRIETQQTAVGDRVRRRQQEVLSE